jgi:hypothetical protein
MMKLLDQAARDILRLNDRGGYTVPTEGLYPYQWNWDSAFAAMGFAQFNVDRAWVEFETLFSGQWDNGMVPHILFHQVDEGYFPGPEMWKSVGPIPSSGITQPPVAATMVRLVFERNPNVGLARLAPLYDKIVAWHDWFMAWRLDQGAVCTTHPWETGRDNAPDWDGAMAAIDPVGVGEYRRRDTSHVDSEMRPTREDYDRYVWLVQRGARLNWDDAAMLQDTPFRMADPSMTFTLMRAQRDLAELGRLLGRDVSTIEGQIAKLESGAQTLWNETLGCYDSRDTRTGEWANSISSASFLCWYGGLPAPQMRAVLTHVLEGVTYGVPSFTPHDPKFEAKRYWRGPVWAVMNMLIGMGLDEMDLPEGQVLREGTADLITKHGFSEYFNPLDGSPAGGGTFTWTAAVWLGWASPDAGQNS